MEALAKSGLIELDAPSALRPAPALRWRNRGQSLDCLAAELDLRVPGSWAHARRVSRYAAGVAKRLGLPREQVALLRRAAEVHDIGKLEISADFLNRAGPLSAAEFALVERHSGLGARMVLESGHEELAPIVRHHHERFDGTGYPDGLAGEEIPLGARIVAVADTFDAVTSPRPYRPARSCVDALDLLVAEAGSQLDPEVVGAFRSYCSGTRGFFLRALCR
jgi:HD-GYP domain-containing protein (c-di-GMP phosphodiesterase class II)